MNGTNEDCAVPLVFDPVMKFRYNSAHITVKMVRCAGLDVWKVDPWTGQPRSAEDIAADPQGLHVWPAAVEDAWFSLQPGEKTRVRDKFGMVFEVQNGSNAQEVRIQGARLPEAINAGAQHVPPACDHYNVQCDTDRCADCGKLGIEIITQEMLAPAGEHAAAPAPGCEHKWEPGCWSIHRGYFTKCLRCGEVQRESAVATGAPKLPAEAELTDSHPIRRNQFNLKEKYPSPPVSRLVGFCHPGVFKEWR